jgi:OmpA-OmpF porin, OOP family
MHKSTMIAGFMAASIATVGSAYAQAGQDRGWYLGGSIGQSSMDIEGCGGVVSCDDKDTAWRILGGYQINRNFAVELGFHQLGDASASFPGGRVDFEANAIELVGIGAVPLANNFAVYAKAGFYRGETEATGSNVAGPIDMKETNTDITYGVGVQYSFNPKFGIRAEWQRYPNMGGEEIGESDIDVLSIGVVVRF